ncbi:starch-binding domain-containing protein 1 [Trichosurus vulpecula]|uniref:starch-binding domain-containing protein 1 n=1 Tax=Trichosurus vulpecula TaxID=9337 RepID=UPI00186B38DC|nr:starch-binding domain-containing protein 1 [Trichosurus vulpecula]
MGAVISALLVGGGLAGALFVWLLRGDSGDQNAGTGEERELSPEEAAAAAPRGNGGDGGGDGGDPLGPKHEQVAQLREQGDEWNVKKAAGEHHQESNGRLVSESKSSDLEGPTWKPQNISTQDLGCLRSGEQLYSTQLQGIESLTLPGLTNSGNYSEILGSESPEHSRPDPLKGQESSSQPVVYSSGKFPSDNLLVDKHEERLKTRQVAGPDLVDHEMMPKHSVRRDADKGSEPSHAGVSVLELQTSSPNQRLDHGRDSLKDAKGQEIHLKTKRVAAVFPLSQQVNVQFQVHYVTMSEATVVAVTGDHETLGSWHSYIPLQCGKDWLWSTSVPLPMDTALKWKFVIVENGSIVRWEECSNRLLETGHEDIIIHKWWGCH